MSIRRGGDRSSGLTEDILGTWLQGKRQRFIVATKCVGRTRPKPWAEGMSSKHILGAIDGSPSGGQSWDKANEGMGYVHQIGDELALV